MALFCLRPCKQYIFVNQERNPKEFLSQNGNFLETCGPAYLVVISTSIVALSRSWMLSLIALFLRFGEPGPGHLGLGNIPQPGPTLRGGERRRWGGRSGMVLKIAFGKLFFCPKSFWMVHILGWGLSFFSGRMKKNTLRECAFWDDSCGWVVGCSIVKQFLRIVFFQDWNMPPTFFWLLVASQIGMCCDERLNISLGWLVWIFYN